MRTITWPTKPLSCLVVIAILSGVIPCRPARAELVATESVLAPSRTPEFDRARVRALLDRKDVQGQLQGYGVSAEEAAARVDALTDREVALIGDRLDEVPAGADAGVFLALALLGPAGVAIIAVLGIGLLIVLTAGIVLAVKKAADAAKQSEPAIPTPSPSSPQPPQAVAPTPQYQWKASESRERAIKEIFCRRRHLEFRSDWRDRLPAYRACLAE